MRFTIFGASGFIGGSLARHLQGLGHEIVAPDRHTRAPPHGNLGHVIYAIGLTADFRSRPFDTITAHVTLASELLQAVQFESFLYLSSTRVYGASPDTREDAAICVRPADPSNLYDLSKLTGEAICLAAPGPNIRIARLSNVVGPSEAGSETFLGALCREARGGHIRLQTALSSAKDYIWIGDVVDVLPRIALNGRSRIYNVARGRQTTHQTWTELIARATGASVSVAPGAPDASFAPINVERLRAEFGLNCSDATAMLTEITG